MITIKLKSAEAPTQLEEEISRVLGLMTATTPETDEYAAMADQLTKLYKIKELDAPDRVSKDGLLAFAGNLAGILMILGYENKHVISSKALGFVTKAVR